MSATTWQAYSTRPWERQGVLTLPLHHHLPAAAYRSRLTLLTRPIRYLTFIHLLLSACVFSSAVEPTCEPAVLREEALPAGACYILDRSCIFQETIVTHDHSYTFDNVRRKELPPFPAIEHWSLPVSLRRLPAQGAQGEGKGEGGDISQEPSTAVALNLTMVMQLGMGISDCLHASEPPYRLYQRAAATHLEMSPALAAPAFSPCALPVLLVADWPLQLVARFFAGVAPLLDGLRARGAIDDRALPALVTPGGMALAPSQALLLRGYEGAAGRLLTAQQLGRPGGAAGPGGGATYGNCYERMLVCRAVPDQPDAAQAAAVGSRVGAQLAAGAADADPAGFGTAAFPPAERGGRAQEAGEALEAEGAAEAEGPTLRVLLEARHGPVSVMRNLQALLAACEAADRAGFSVGPFRRLACRPHDFDPERADTLVSPAQLRANAAAVRSAHVLVAVNGEAASYALFMRGFAPPAMQTADDSGTASDTLNSTSGGGRGVQGAEVAGGSHAGPGAVGGGMHIEVACRASTQKGRNAQVPHAHASFAPLRTPLPAVPRLSHPQAPCRRVAKTRVP